MDPMTIAALAEQAILLGLQVYKQIEADHAAKGTPIRPLADILAEADQKFAAGATLAQQELDKP